MTATAVAVRQNKELQAQPGRFKVASDSQSGHCCFDYTVVDTNRPRLMHGKQYNMQFLAVCECFYEAEAEAIAAGLNLLAETQEIELTDRQ